MTRTSIALSVLLALGCIGWAGYTASADTPDYVIHDDGTQLAESYVPGTHVVAVAASDGTTYTITSALAATVDGDPIVLAQADTGSAAGPTVTVDTASVTAEPADTGSASTPAAAPDADSAATVPPIGSPLDELAAVKAKYEALKAAKGSGSKDLLWFAYAALAAAVIRVLLAGLTAWRGDKPKGWAKWAALGLAVPLALLTYYAAGAGWWQAIVMAGAGPGAIIVNELLKRKTAPAS